MIASAVLIVGPSAGSRGFLVALPSVTASVAALHPFWNSFIAHEATNPPANPATKPLQTLLCFDAIVVNPFFGIRVHDASTKSGASGSASLVFRFGQSATNKQCV